MLLISFTFSLLEEFPPLISPTFISPSNQSVRRSPSFNDPPPPLFLKSLSVFFCSVLLCCIPVPGVEGVDEEAGGKEKRCGVGERLPFKEIGGGGGFLYENAFSLEC